MLRHPIVAPANECPNRRRRGIKNVDAIFFNDFPEPVGFRPIRRAFVHDCGRTVRERTIDNVAVACYPADIRRALENILISNVEHILRG